MLVEPFQTLRTLELAWLDELQSSVYEKALGGDISAIDSVLAISQRRARLMGLDQPARSSGVEDRDHLPAARVEIAGDPQLVRSEEAARRMLGETRRRLG